MTFFSMLSLFAYSLIEYLSSDCGLNKYSLNPTKKNFDKDNLSFKVNISLFPSKSFIKIIGWHIGSIPNIIFSFLYLLYN